MTIDFTVVQVQQMECSWLELRIVVESKIAEYIINVGKMEGFTGYPRRTAA
jgi:hypothetical protein